MAWTMKDGKIHYDEETRKQIDQAFRELKEMIDEDEKLEAQGHVFDYSFMDDLPEDDDDDESTEVVILKKPETKKKQTKR